MIAAKGGEWQVKRSDGSPHDQGFKITQGAIVMASCESFMYVKMNWYTENAQPKVPFQARVTPVNKMYRRL